MTKHLVGNVFFMYNYPVVCHLEIKLSPASSCMVEKREEPGLCSQTDLGLNLTLTPAVRPWESDVPSQRLGFLGNKAECLMWL